MNRPDPFDELARFYDPIMNHVDYDRWFMITAALADLLPDHFRHLDAACGTGTLLGMLRTAGWISTGFDLSPAMLRAARKQRGELPVLVADLQALPFNASFDMITCLFDSINFLLEETLVRRALRELAGALAEGGILYFDAVTERMVTEYFEGDPWTENNGGFATTWATVYDRKSGIADTELRINTGVSSLLRERMYPLESITQAVEEAGLTLFACYDTATWRRPNRKTARADFIAVRNPARSFKSRFRTVNDHIRKIVYTR
jgi:SAM-dependent methyltransferase